jgi:hypothetical protein
MQVRALLVDDQPEELPLALIRSWCQSHDIAFEQCQSVKEAKLYLASNPIPQLVITDYNFERAPDPADRADTGLGFLDYLNARRPYDCVIVFMTEKDRSGGDLLESGRERGAQIVIAKQNFTRTLTPRLEEAYRTILARSAPAELAERVRELDLVTFGDDGDRRRLPIFLITPFPRADKDDALYATLSSVKSSLELNNAVGLRASDSVPASTTVNSWVRAHMHYCRAGIAILARRVGHDSRTFNPNVAYEMGYMSALGKPVLLLRLDKRMDIPANLEGIVVFDVGSPAEIDEQVRKLMARIRT